LVSTWLQLRGRSVRTCQDCWLQTLYTQWQWITCPHTQPWPTRIKKNTGCEGLSNMRKQITPETHQRQGE
jgi:hypothetical protein